MKRFDGMFGLLLFAGCAVIVGAHVLEGGRVGSLFQPGAALIVFGGTLAAVLLQVPWADLRSTAHALGGLFTKLPDERRASVDHYVNITRRLRRDGPTAVEASIDGISDAFSRRALRAAIDGAEPSKLRHRLDAELARAEADGDRPIRVIEAAAGYSPTIGILGAVLGLMHVMERLDNPSSLGDGIAVAFVATVYGVGLANLVLLPVAGRLRLRLENHLALLELSVEAALAISEGDPPSTVENRLTGILESEEISGGRLRRAA